MTKPNVYRFDKDGNRKMGFGVSEIFLVLDIELFIVIILCTSFLFLVLQSRMDADVQLTEIHRTITDHQPTIYVDGEETDTLSDSAAFARVSYDEKKNTLTIDTKKIPFRSEMERTAYRWLQG